MGMWRRCFGAMTLLTVIGGGLAGCASAPTSAAAAPPPSASVRASAGASVTPSPTPTPTPTPRVSATPFVSAADEAGAYAFVKAYFAELNRAYATGDVSRLAPYRQPTCICVGKETGIVEAYASGGRIAGVSFNVLKWAYGAHGPSFARTAIYFQLGAVRHLSPGKPTVVDPPISGLYAIDLRRMQDHWSISDIRFERAS